MNMKTVLWFFMGIVIVSGFTGCMTVRDTSGIKQYLQDQGKAETLALKIKSKHPDKNSEPYRKAENLYDKAAGAGNGWTKAISLDARLHQKINVSTADYQSSTAGKDISAFLALDNGVQPAFDPVTGAAIAKFIVDLIDMLEKQHNARVEGAVKVLETEFNKARWTTFEATTPKWVDDKYKSGQ